MMKRTLKGFIAGIALVVALLSTSINVFAWESSNGDEMYREKLAVNQETRMLGNDFSINGNVKVKEGLDVILENIE